MMMNVLCQFDWATEFPDTDRSDVIPDVSVRKLCMRLRYKLVDWVKQIAFPILSGPHPIRWRPEWSKSLNLLWVRRHFSCLTDCLSSGTSDSSCFWTWSETSALPLGFKPVGLWTETAPLVLLDLQFASSSQNCAASINMWDNVL